MSWTDERVEVLKKLWNDGLSASQIAAELGSVTRNAVIGKVHRLGLSGRGKTSAAVARTRPARTPAAPVRNRPATGGSIGNAALKMTPEEMPQTLPAPRNAPFEELVIPFGERAGIMQLTESTCRWPIGDPASKDFHFCGRGSDNGVPYCAYHRRIAYQPSSDRRREKRAIAG